VAQYYMEAGGLPRCIRKWNSERLMVNVGWKTHVTDDASGCERNINPYDMFTAHELNARNWPEQVDPVTRRIYWSRASALRLYFLLIGCSETRTVSVRLVLNTCIPMWLFTLDFANWSSVQFSSCAVNEPLTGHFEAVRITVAAFAGL